MATIPTQGQLQSAFGSNYVPPKGSDYNFPGSTITAKPHAVVQDQLMTVFNNGQPNAQTVNRWTSYNIERDFLGQVADATVYPYMGTGGQKEFHFEATDTFQTAMETIFANFGLDVVTDDSKALTFATGFGAGIRTKGKTAKGMSSSYTGNLNHLVKPRIGEKYLSYALRLAHLRWAFIKMLPGSNSTVWIGTPIYARDDGNNPYSIVHTRTGNSSPTIESGKMSVSFKDQPSMIVMQGAYGDPIYRKQTFKVIAINELTAFPRNAQTPLLLSETIPSVQETISELTTGKVSSGVGTTQQVTPPQYRAVYPAQKLPDGTQQELAGPPKTFVKPAKNIYTPPTGYSPLPLKSDLYNNLPGSIVGLDTDISRPEFLIDHEAHNADELRFGCAKKLAEIQQKYFNLEYTIDGHTQNNIVWYPNLMCKVQDDTFDPTRQVAGLYWVEKVNFMRSRSGGTKTTIKLNLPYIFENELV